MSNIWNKAAMADVAQPLSGWGGFGDISGRGSFRTLYSEGQAFDNRRVVGDFEPMARPAAPADPMDVARQEAFAAGFNEGFTVAQQDQTGDAEARLQLAQSIGQLNPVATGTLSTMLSTAVLRLVAQIVGEAAIDVDLLTERCRAVAACIDEDGSVLRLHPDDIPLLEGAELGVDLVADADISRGGVRLDTADGWIEDGPDVRLARLKSLFDDMAGRA